MLRHAADHELARSSADAVVPHILAIVRPSSVVDFGCGKGAWLEALGAAGLSDLVGVDFLPPDQVSPSLGHYVQRDLARPVDLERRFDLALSLEVAEHLPAPAAPTFVESLCRHAPVVVFSAAAPGQGGPGHVNEQWPAYWSGLFAAHGRLPLDWMRPLLWTDGSVAWWYRQNMLIFADPDVVQRLAAPEPRATPLALVHPDAEYPLRSTFERLLKNPFWTRSQPRPPRRLRR